MPALTTRQLMGPPPSPEYCAENNSAEILGIAGGLMSAAAVVVLLRMYVRIFMLKSVGSDDYVMISALLMAVGTFICFVGETHYAIGRHTACIGPYDFEMYARWQYFHSIWVMAGVILVKISVALFLMRLVPPTRKWKQFLWASIGQLVNPATLKLLLTPSTVFLVAFMITCAATIIFACVPIEASWKFELRMNPGTRCFSNETFTMIGLINSSINCATDFLFAILPIPVIIRLQVNLRTKIVLCFILSLGYIACASGIVKAVQQHNFFTVKDPTFHNGFNVWNMVELCVGILAASLPSLRPLFARVLEKAMTTFHSNYYTSKGGSGHGASNALPSSYQRQRNSSEIHGDIKMETWQDVSNPTSTTSSGRTNWRPDRTQQKAVPTVSVRPTPDRYCVFVSSGQEPRDDGTWQDVEVGRSQSQEHLQPAGPGIMKTVATTQVHATRR